MKPDDVAQPAQPQNSGSRPVPDPTVLTTQQLLREVSMLRDVIETRLGGMDKAIELLQRATDKFPEEIKGEVRQLQQLHEEKFRSVALQFTERDTRTEQTSRDSKVAVDAALQAAKEAVGEQNKSNATANSKMEAAFTKQIDQISVLISTTDKATDDKIDDIKERLTTIESHKKGASDSWGYILAAITTLVALAMMIIPIIRK